MVIEGGCGGCDTNFRAPRNACKYVAVLRHSRGWEVDKRLPGPDPLKPLLR